MRLDEAKCAVLVRVAILHKASPDVLSVFEMATLWDLTERALDKDIEAQITAEEWAVVEGAEDVLTKAFARPPVVVFAGQTIQIVNRKVHHA